MFFLFVYIICVNFDFSDISTSAPRRFVPVAVPPEAPRSIAVNFNNKKNNNKINSATSDGLKLRDKIEEILLTKAPHKPFVGKNDQEITTKNQLEEKEEEKQPFTVVRVSSSVSQVRAKL